MAFVQSLPIQTPCFPSQCHFHLTKNFTVFSKLPLKTPRNSFPVLACSAPNSLPDIEQDILQAIAESDGANGKSLPSVRTYENDLARLTLVGAVNFEQALTAAAADGGEVASEHINSGVPAMVVETVFPGPSDEHSTVSTRLFLPARKVKEKAKKLRSSLTQDILSNTTSKNILAMTFRQVVLQQLWNFELVLFRPGTERNMGDLENPREVPASFTLSSSDERSISVLAEVVCVSALESTERHFIGNFLGKKSNNFFSWFQKHRRIVSKDSSVMLYELFEDEIVANAKSLLENFNSKKANFKPIKTKLKNYWWTSSACSILERIGGPEFSTWTREHIPAYRLQIDTNKLINVRFEGWKRTGGNRWEVLLTHSQMVGLANILDMYYEDLFTLPEKQLSCGVVAKSTSFSIKKSTSFLKMLSITLASGIILLTFNVLGQLYFPHLQKGRKYPGENRSLQTSEINIIQHHSLESTELEAFCVSIVKRVKDACGWPGEIMKETNVGAWTGELPKYLIKGGEADASIVDMSSTSSSPEESDTETGTSAQDIASYQVVLSNDGKIVGLQPTSRAAVNHWGANPLAKELYGGRKLSPGFMEPGLKISQPSDVVVLELLMSVNPVSSFALARPAD